MGRQQDEIASSPTTDQAQAQLARLALRLVPVRLGRVAGLER